jgi:hypothetical protein
MLNPQQKKFNERSGKRIPAVGIRAIYSSGGFGFKSVLHGRGTAVERFLYNQAIVSYPKAKPAIPGNLYNL